LPFFEKFRKKFASQINELSEDVSVSNGVLVYRIFRKPIFEKFEKQNLSKNWNLFSKKPRSNANPTPCRTGKHRCHICQEAFYQKDMLKRHVLSLHDEVTSFRGRGKMSLKAAIASGKAG
jgi:hypothetical protein